MRKTLSTYICLSLIWMLGICFFPTCTAPAQENGTAIHSAESTHSDTADDDKALAELHAIVRAVHKRAPDSLSKYREWIQQHQNPERILGLYPDRYPPKNIITLARLAKMNKLAEDALTYAGKALSNPDFDVKHFHDLVLAALAADSKDTSLAVQTVEFIAGQWKNADSIRSTRDALLSQYHDEIRKGNINTGTRLAWSLIRIGAADNNFEIIPESFVYDADSAAIWLRHEGVEIRIPLDKGNYQEYFQAAVDGYNFRSGWSVLFQKPLSWMIDMARDMRADGLAPDYHDEWEVMEAPEGLIALAVSGTNGKRNIPLRAFYNNALRNVAPIPTPSSAGAMAQQFRDAAKTLHDGIMNDESIPLPLRHALEPILLGTYNPIDKRDYFDNDFCRRLIEADYLEHSVKNLSYERKSELRSYRNALEKIDAGLDRFSIDLGDDGMLIAVSKPEIDVHDGEELETRDPETGENLSPWQWRWEKEGLTIFHSPMPGRGLYAFSVIEKYDGEHKTKPAGVPGVTEVWHAIMGNVAGYRMGDDAATGNKGDWLQAIRIDASGRRDGTSGPLGWNFPLYVPVRDDQGDPVLIATLNGVVESPSFTEPEGKARHQAQDDWLDKAARVFATPGEMALIYHIFFRYCSDSPLPEMPNLIGSHRGLSDTHQTVYQSLDRKWVGRLIGDCDDLAEFFQNIAIRQGKLAHVMQLPAHAAAGWLEEAGDDGYQFIVLQSGPVLRFIAETREEAVEKAYRHFEDETGSTHYTAAAVPLLLRFGDDDTRTAFVLSSRIYWDREYAEKMIEVQSYWHIHAYSAAIKVMEEMISHDREVGNLKELASLYEMIGMYDKSDDMRRQELAAVGDDEQAKLSTLLDIAQLHVRDKNKDKAMEALTEMEERFLDWRESNSGLYDRSMSFRSSWAFVLARLDEPDRAWMLLKPDVDDALKSDGKLSDTMLRTLLTIYDRMSLQRDASGDMELDRSSVRNRYRIRSALARSFGKGYFLPEDSYNKIHSRYFLLGRYGVAVAGRLAGLQSLFLDGPFPDGPRIHADRTEDLSEEDWEWFRIMPRLYLAYGVEMLDKEEYPRLYDPQNARRSLELVARAIKKGTGLGSNVMGRDVQLKANLILSFVNHDLTLYKESMDQVRERNYSSLYDDAATVFGSYCGLVPEAEFAEWLDAFHHYFPKRQHYFKAAYRALEKGHYPHAVRLGNAAARYFADDPLMVEEAKALTSAAVELRGRRQEQGWFDRDWACAHGADSNAPAAWMRELVSVE